MFFITLRECEHCGHYYSFDPSGGFFGVICPKCNKGQSSRWPKKTKRIFKFGKKMT